MALELTLKNYRCFSDRHPARFRIGDGITAFIGTNHAGKSSLLKFFFEFRDLFFRLANGQFLGAIGQLVPFNYNGLSDQTEVFCNLNSRPLSIELDPLGSLGPIDLFRIEIGRGTNTARVCIQAQGHNVDAQEMSIREGTLTIVTGPQQKTLMALTDVTAFFGELAATTYVPAFRNAINVGSASPYFDMHAGQSFISNWQALKTGPTKASNEEILRLTDDIRELFKFTTLEINATADGQALQIIIGGKSYRMSEVGSGLMQFILTLATVGARSSAYVLLDEPELNLHPSLQISFVTTVAAYASAGLCFATHSIGLARATAERVYTVRRLADGSSDVVPLEAQGRLAEFLGELGYLGYREIGFDRILLVEGPKDLKAVQQILRTYAKDNTVLLLPLGGSSGINATAESQLAELFRITDKVSALIDSEKTQWSDDLDPSRKGFTHCCAKIGVDCHVLERRAIENYLTESAVQAVKGDKYRALGPYESLADVDPSWAKEENWRIVREMDRQELDDTDLGQFLRSL